ncbi:MAG: VanZ family protein [Clostridia bacterium]|nr:VanZ family protein [Clostridia bacterium]
MTIRNARSANMTTMKNAAKIAFVLYIALMIWLLFGQRMGNDVQGGYWNELSQNINLTPFETVGKYLNTLKNSENGRISHQAVINLGGNVIMFVPLGFLLPLNWGRAKSLKGCMTACLIIIMCVELIQLFTLLGSFDVDDLILNMAGVWIGYMIYSINISE